MKITYQRATTTKQGITVVKVDLDGRNVGRIIKTADPGWQYFPKWARANGGGPLFPGGIEGLAACQKSLEETEPRYLGPEANAILAEQSCPGCGNPNHAGSCPDDTPSSSKFYQPYQPEAERESKPTYENTYWSHKGKHEDLYAALYKLVPMMGAVPNPEDNKALEQFRRASNCYYDLYNDGGGNLYKEFREVFGFEGPCTEDESEYSLNDFSRDDEWMTQENIDRVESKMDEIILAAHAQHFPTLPPGLRITEVVPRGTIEEIDLTPVGCQTPEGVKRVRKTQQEWDSATHELANTLKEALEGYVYGEGFCGDELHQLKALVGARDRKQEAFLRAVAGAPEK